MSLKETFKQHPSYLKKGKQWLANKFGCSENEVEEAKEALQVEKAVIYEKNEKVDVETGDVRSEYIVDFKPKSIEQLYILHNIDKKQYTIKNYWSKVKSSGKFTSSVFAVKNKGEIFDVASFIHSYIPPKYEWNIKKYNVNSPASIIINKQDAHFNKVGESSDTILKRTRDYENKIEHTIEKVSKIHSLDEIIYIIGSDHFNAEFTGTTVKGTPQDNIGSYTDSFREICSHETRVINYLLSRANSVKVFYLPGNHDAFVSFHMSEWLKAFFKGHERVSVCSEFQYTKYFSLYDTAVCINHGDVIKPEALAQIFPIAYKEGFAAASHWIVMCGDKHTELTRDIGGIKFYRISAISNAKSNWEKQKGYTITKAEITTLVIEPEEGVNMILKS